MPLSVFLLLKFKFIERVKKLELRILKRFGRKKFSCYTEKDTKLISTNIIRKGVFSTSFRWYCTILSVATLKYVPHSLTSNNIYFFIFTIVIWLIEMFAAMSKREIIWMYSILLFMCLSPWVLLLVTYIESIDGTSFSSVVESIMSVFPSISVDYPNEIYMATSISSYTLILLFTTSVIYLLSIIFETVLVQTIIARIKFLQRLFS